MDSLIHLIYASTAVYPFDRLELFSLLAKAQENNGKIGVTGILLYEHGNFLQVLEGPASQVLPLYERITQDKRHCRTVKIIAEPIAERAFGNWTMGFAKVTPEELRQVDGLSDFFAAGTDLAAMGSGRARKLLNVFRTGRWHRKAAPADSTEALDMHEH